MSPRVLYFGCIRDAGHYLWNGERSTMYGDARQALPFNWTDLDGGETLPGARERGRWVGRGGQSVCKLTHAHGWTFVGCWDNSVDTRPGSNSTFLAPGTLTFEEVLALAREVFPSVVARIEKLAPLTLEVTP
jgi:hypothetical protein